MLTTKTLFGRRIKTTEIENIALLTINHLRDMANNNIGHTYEYPFIHLPAPRRYYVEETSFNADRNPKGRKYHFIFDTSKEDLYWEQWAYGEQVRYVGSITYLEQLPMKPPPFQTLSLSTPIFTNTTDSTYTYNLPKSHRQTPYVGIHILDRIYEQDWQRSYRKHIKKYDKAIALEYSYPLIIRSATIAAAIGGVAAAICSFLSLSQTMIK